MKSLILIFLLSFTLINFQSRNERVYRDIIKIKGYLDSLHVENTDIVISQAVYETGWFNCNNCCFKYNNLFGFIGN